MALPISAYFQPQLALSKYRLRSRAKTKPNPVLSLTGRPAGFFHTILNIFGLSPITEMQVTTTEVRMHTKNLFGDIVHLLPLRNVDAVAAGSSKPTLYMALAFMSFGMGISFMAVAGAMALVAGLGGALLFFVLFLLGQSFVLTFTGGDTTLSVRFKKGGAARVEYPMLMQAVEVIRELIQDADQPGGSKTHAAGAAVEEYEDEEEEEYEEEPPRRGGRRARDDDDD